jgi:hypothetical protein
MTAMKWSRFQFRLFGTELARVYAQDLTARRRDGCFQDPRTRTAAEHLAYVQRSPSCSTSLPLMILRVAVMGMASTISRRSGQRIFAMPCSAR